MLSNRTAAKRSGWIWAAYWFNSINIRQSGDHSGTCSHEHVFRDSTCRRPPRFILPQLAGTLLALAAARVLWGFYSRRTTASRKSRLHHECLQLAGSCLPVRDGPDSRLTTLLIHTGLPSPSAIGRDKFDYCAASIAGRLPSTVKN